MLFNINVKPLGEVIWRLGVYLHQYADGTDLYLSFTCSVVDAIQVLECCLASVLEWIKTNRLRLNPENMEILLGVFQTC